MTVLNGDGLVGRVTTVGPDTATVLLANDPDFTVGTRMEGTDELGFASGQGDRPLRVAAAQRQGRGARRATGWSPSAPQADKPFVPGVPVGKVVRRRPLRRRPDPHRSRSRRSSASPSSTSSASSSQAPRRTRATRVLPAEARSRRPRRRSPCTVTPPRDAAAPTATTATQQ